MDENGVRNLDGHCLMSVYGNSLMSIDGHCLMNIDGRTLMGSFVADFRFRKLARAADTEHSNQHIWVKAARISGRARCGAGAGCSAMKHQSLLPARLRRRECDTQKSLKSTLLPPKTIRKLFENYSKTIRYSNFSGRVAKTTIRCSTDSVNARL